MRTLLTLNLIAILVFLGIVVRADAPASTVVIPPTAAPVCFVIGLPGALHVPSGVYLMPQPYGNGTGVIKH
jgi:hypothetical protein